MSEYYDNDDLGSEKSRREIIDRAKKTREEFIQKWQYINLTILPIMIVSNIDMLQYDNNANDLQYYMEKIKEIYLKAKDRINEEIKNVEETEITEELIIYGGSIVNDEKLNNIIMEVENKISELIKEAITRKIVSLENENKSLKVKIEKLENDRITLEKRKEELEKSIEQLRLEEREIKTKLEYPMRKKTKIGFQERLKSITEQLVVLEAEKKKISDAIYELSKSIISEAEEENKDNPNKEVREDNEKGEVLESHTNHSKEDDDNDFEDLE